MSAVLPFAHEPRERSTRHVGAKCLAAVAVACGFYGGCTQVPPARPSEVDAGPDGGADAVVAHDGAQAACPVHDPQTAYVKGPFAFDVSATLPNEAFDGIDEQAASSHRSLATWLLPCSAEPALLVLRIGAAFCGTCVWSAKHNDLFETNGATYIDLLVANDTNRPPSKADLQSYQSAMKVPHAMFADPAHRFRGVSPEQPVLPLYLYIDRRSMKLLSVLSDPEPGLAVAHAQQELSQLNHFALPPTPKPILDDGLLVHHRGVLEGMTMPSAPPADTTNHVADSGAARALGQALFTDAALSPSGTVACATCHDSTKGFADGRATALGVAQGDRNTPSVLFASYNRFQFWDGRADSLWMQATGPFENSKEMASSRSFVAHAIANRYRSAYTLAFPEAPLPDLADTARYPANGKPGDPAYDVMSPADQATVTHVFVNVGKALAAYERSLRAAPNALDRYLGGDRSALSVGEKRGMGLFFTSGCAQCHWGPTLSDGAFHNIRFPTGRMDGLADPGRSEGVQAAQGSEFSALSGYSDAPVSSAQFALTNGTPGELVGAFKTPSLRGVADTAPYGHGGTFADLRAVVKHYGQQGLKPGDPKAVGATEPWVPRFDDHLDANIDDLAEFLRILTAKNM